ncbi:MAG: type I 3-dehydroquinate dehydratase, partial [Citrobacter sp.]|uniref:type I 3-dehydroquinate dehydratase n=1 Tax=Citrobacter sp. TaxID=1896336 RepID=UPI003D105AC8
MKTVTVKNLVIGEGAPKIIVSLMGKDIASDRAEAQANRDAHIDIIEWRVDHIADVASA